MKAFVVFDGDRIGDMVEHKALRDEPEALRTFSNHIESGGEIWKSWAILAGGSLVFLGDNGGKVEVPAEHLDDVSKIRNQYKELVGASCSVGIGMKLSEAERSLMCAKLRGGDRIVFYSPQVDEDIEKLQDKEAGKDKLEELFGKSEGVKESHEILRGEKKLRLEHYSQRQEEAPKVPKEVYREHLGEVGGAEIYLVNGLYVRDNIDEDFTTDANPGRYGYVPEGEIWLDDILDHKDACVTIVHAYIEYSLMANDGKSYSEAHDVASEYELECREGLPDDMGGDLLGPARKYLEEKGKTDLEKAELPGRNTQIRPEKPKAEASEHSQGEAIHSLVEDNQPEPVETTHAAKDLEEHFSQLFQQQSEKKEPKVDEKHIDEAKAQVVQALQVIKQQEPVLEQIKQTAPQTYQAMMLLVQSVIGMAKELSGEIKKAEGDIDFEALQKGKEQIPFVDFFPEKTNDYDLYRYMSGLHTGARVDLNKIPMDTDYELVNIPLDKLPANVPWKDSHAQALARLQTPSPPIIVGFNGSVPDGHHRIAAARIRGEKTVPGYVPVQEIENYRGDVEKAELPPKTELSPEVSPVVSNHLEKAGLPMPSAKSRIKRLIMPVGTRVGNSIKVKCATGATRWVQAGSGQIQSQDPGGAESAPGHPVSSRLPGAR